MSIQKEKLKEAGHFLSNAEEYYQYQNLQDFKYSLSVFSPVARSVLQYTLKSAQQHGRQ